MKRTIPRIFMSAAMFLVILAGCEKDEPTPTTDPSPTTVSVTGVTLNKASMNLVEGKSEVLSATVSPDNATNKAISWKSSDAAVASVDATGKVTAVKAGSATITVTTTDGSKTATCAVTVTAKEVKVTGITVDPAILEIKEGTTSQLKVVITPADATSKDITWKSTNTEAATVDGSGLVTALKEGKTRIVATVTGSEIEAFCEVTVTPDDALKGIEFTAGKVEVGVGKTTTLEIAFTPTYAANKNVTFSSSNTSIATVASDGTVTGVADGETTITATSEEGSFTATCVVAVSSSFTSGLYYNLGWDLYRDGTNLNIFAPYGNAMDTEGNIYYGHETGEAYKLALSKNGVDYMEVSTKGIEYGIMSAAGGGYYFMPYTYTYERNAAVRRYSDNGEEKEFTLHEGSESYCSFIRDIAVDANGNAYIAGAFKDEYKVLNAIVFKVATDGKVTSTKLSSGTSNWECLSVAVSEKGDVYAAVWDKEKTLYIYKNGEQMSKLTDKFCRFGHYCDLTVKGEDLYICSTEQIDPEDDEDHYLVRIYKNGTALYTISQPVATYGENIIVSDSGDIYVAGDVYDGTENKYFIWKNDAALYSLPSSVTPNSLFIK